MDERLLTEINRNREIMGLEGLLTESSEKEVIAGIEGGVDEIIEVFKKIDPAEREEFKTTIIGDLKDKDIDEVIINKLIEEFDKIEKVPIKEQRGIGRYFDWRKWRKKTFWGTVRLFTGFRNVGKGRKRHIFGRGGISFESGWIKKGKQGSDKKVTSVEEVDIDLPEEDWDEFYEKYNENFTSKIKKGKKVWTNAWTQEDGKYRPFVISSLEDYSELKRRGRKKVDIYVGNDPEKTITPGPVKEYPDMETEFPGEGQPSSDYFDDNEFNVSGVFVDNFAEFLDKLKAKSSELQVPEGKPAFWLKALAVETSCSAIKNGQSSDGKTRTWEQLAQDRAQTGVDYILEQLQAMDPPCAVGSNGGGLESEIDINAKGENYGKESADGISLNGTSGDVWGDPNMSTDKASYEKNKFFRTAFNIVINTKYIGKKDREDDIITWSDKLVVRLVVPPTKGWGFGMDWAPWFRLPKLKWRPLGFLAGMFGAKKYNTTRCPNF